MKNSLAVLVSSIGCLIAMTGNGMSEGRLPKVFSGGTGATTSQVQIFQPTRNVPPVDAEAEPNIAVFRETVVHYVVVRSAEAGYLRSRKPLGQRYLGVFNRYSGRRYPF